MADIPLAPHAAAVGGGLLLVAAAGLSPTALVGLDVDSGEEIFRVAAPEPEYRTGAPAITDAGDFTLAIQGLRGDGLYIVRGTSSQQFVLAVDPPDRMPEHPQVYLSGRRDDLLWSLPTGDGFVFLPRPFEIEWRFDESHRSRAFHESPIGWSEDLVFTRGQKIVPDAFESSDSPRIRRPRGVRPGAPRVEGPPELVLRSRGDGSRIASRVLGESRFPGSSSSFALVGIDPVCLLRKAGDVLTAESISDPGTTLWQLSVGPDATASVRDGWIVAHDGARIRAWQG